MTWDFGFEEQDPRDRRMDAIVDGVVKIGLALWAVFGAAALALVIAGCFQ